MCLSGSIFRTHVKGDSYMRKLAIAVALASTAMATPAVARDHSFYAGVEGGVLYVEDMSLDVTDDDGEIFDAGTVVSNAVSVSHHSGFDIDLVAGYDFGLVRLEGELGYKRASVNQLIIDPRIAGGGPGDNYDADGRG